MKKMKWRGGLCKCIAATVLASVALLSCELELSDKNTRLINPDVWEKAYTLGEELESGAGIDKITDDTDCLVLTFKTTGTCPTEKGDQVILFSRSAVNYAGVTDEVSVRTGYFGTWAKWDAGINEGAATDGFAKASLQTAFRETGKGCAFVFKKGTGKSSSVYYYVDGKLAISWENVESDWAGAVIQAAKEGLTIGNGTGENGQLSTNVKPTNVKYFVGDFSDCAAKFSSLAAQE